MSANKEMTRTLFVSTSYPRDQTDWRGMFMAHISRALARNPEVSVLQWAPPGEVDPAVDLATTELESQWLATLMQRGGISHWLRTRPPSGAIAAAKLLRMLRAVYRRTGEVDLYHINWLQCALPLPADHKPALITVLGNDMRLLRLPFMRTMLRRVMRRRKVVLCPNATWMQAPLQAAFGDLAHVQPVSFGIDPRWYAVDRRVQTHGEPARWIVVSRLTADKLGDLFAWSQPMFAGTSRELHLFGPMQEALEIPGWVRYHGPASAEQLAGDWFPRACGLITLSRHAEGRPQVMLEAMAAGLPIIASAMPAHADFINDNDTGMLCDTQAAYRATLSALEDAQANRRIGTAAREWARREVGTWDDCAQRYVAIYHRLLGGSSNER